MRASAQCGTIPNDNGEYISPSELYNPPRSTKLQSVIRGRFILAIVVDVKAVFFVPRKSQLVPGAQVVRPHERSHARKAVLVACSAEEFVVVVDKRERPFRPEGITEYELMSRVEFLWIDSREE